MDGSSTDEARAARERQSWVRHELRAPLAVIYPLVSLLRDGGACALTEEQSQYIDMLDRNLVRLEALIAGAVESGWADCSAAPPVPEEVVLADVAEELIALRRGSVEGGPSVAVTAGPPPTPRAWADRDDVRQIVSDLLRNATAYGAEGGHVVVRAAAGSSPGTVVVEVVDAGPGMAPAELARAFEFGFRGELARSLGVPGLGAGLWVSRQLAERNGGSLELASAPGRTVAALVLPASEAVR